MAFNDNANGGARFNYASAPVLIRPSGAPPAGGQFDLSIRQMLGCGRGPKPFVDTRQPQSPQPQINIRFSVNVPIMNSTHVSPIKSHLRISLPNQSDKVKGPREEEKRRKKRRTKQEKGINFSLITS